jgi:2-keto-4-pentenoate hydratase/2-oxohepta-3-ene-1,7-dioic acid hydratase in catechol pathway
MKYARYLAHGQVSYGVLDGETLREITTTPFEEYEITDHTHGLSEVKLLPPTAPSKILAVGLNYSSHLHDRPAPEEPLIFIKTPSSLIGHGDAIVRPGDVETLDEEGELVIVIKSRCRNVSKEDALSYVLGYTCGNDVSAREWQRGDGQWWRAKSTDTFSAAGPCISDEIDPGNVMLRARVNGQEVQAESTSYFIFDVPTAISWISRRMTLEAGDLIFTGTPGTPAHLNAGDIVEVDIEGIGVLSNPVRMEE